jgi:hypothetical protein
MGITLDGAGHLLVLDQVNRRIQRFDASTGRLLSALPIQSETAQDLLADAQGRTHVLSRLGASPGIEVYDENGKLTGRLSVVGGKVSEAGSVTGLFRGSDGIYVESQHDDLVRVADGQGKQSSLTETLPGRPSRDGRLYLKAGIIDKQQGRVYVQAHGLDLKLAWETPLGFPSPVLHLLLLDSDKAGHIYLGAEVGQEDPTTHAVTDLATLVARLDGQGTLGGVLTLPPTTSEATETFRPLTVDDEGVIYQMVHGPNGVTVTAYHF